MRHGGLPGMVDELLDDRQIPLTFSTDSRTRVLLGEAAVAMQRATGSS